MYDASGNVRTVSDGPARLLGAKLAGDETAAIVATDRDGNAITVRVRQDGSFTATTSTDRGQVQFDSRDALSHDAVVVKLGERAAALVAAGAAGGTDVGLAEAAAGVLNAAFPVGSRGSSVLSATDGGSSLEGFTLSVTDANGTSRYVGGADGVVSASRSTGAIDLEVVTIDGGLTADSVRGADGSGATTLSGGALGGTVFSLAHDPSGTESVTVTSRTVASGTTLAPVALAARTITDAFGERATIGGTNGKPEIALHDALGDAFTFSAGSGGNDASLGVAINIGGTTGTKRALLREDASATTQTGSTIHAAGSLEATGNPDEGGSISLHVAESVIAASAAQQGIVTTDAAATLQLGADVAGTLDVSGSAGASALNGFRDAKGVQKIAGGSSRQAAGGASLFRADARRVLDVTVDANDEEKHAAADTKHENGATHDVAMLAVSAFGSRAGAIRTDDILRHHDKPAFSGTETLF